MNYAMHAPCCLDTLLKLELDKISVDHFRHKVWQISVEVMKPRKLNFTNDGQQEEKVKKPIGNISGRF